MRIPNQLSICAAFAALITVTASPSSGQQLTGSPAAPEYKYSTPLSPGIASPDTVETRLGRLKFFDGFPERPSVEKLYDNLDFQRACRTFRSPSRNQIKSTNRI